MINRIFKTILVLTICLGLTIPTNAAVSVSDGSAFVTKAEFAADLNNLSNRMAQLENSLDAKIDSLVSSYLTRNGIWNGAKQDVSLNKIRYNMFELYGSVVAHKFRSFYPNSAGTGLIKYEANNYCMPINYPTYSKDFTIVNNINKSGLCTVEYICAITSFWSTINDVNSFDETLKWYNGTVGYEDLSKLTSNYSSSNPFGCGAFYALDLDASDAISSVDAGALGYIGGVTFLSKQGSNEENKMFRPLIQSFSQLGGGNIRTQIGSSPRYSICQSLNANLSPVAFFDSFFIAKGDEIVIRFQDIWSGRMYNSYSIVANGNSVPFCFRNIQINKVNVY